MLVDFGLVRFLTKVSEKSQRGLKLILFKEKKTNQEKMIFLVKTASEDLEKLALSKMTWQVEQSKASVKVIIVRLLILPEGAKDFFRSESGLLITEEKDYKSLQALYNQKSIEIYFFSYDSEFHSKIELLTTSTMSNNVKVLLENNPFIDENRLIVKSENLSQKDIQDAISGKVQNTDLKDKDILDSLQKKMPVISTNNKIPKSKLEEFSKTSIKSNDIKSNNSTNIFKPEESTSKIKDTISSVSKNLKEDNVLDIINSIPPSKGLSADDLLGIISDTKDTISSVSKNLKEDNVLDIINSIPPSKGLSANDLLSIISDTKDTISSVSKNLKEDNVLDIINSIPPSKGLSTDDLLSSFNFQENSNSNSLNKEELLKTLGNSKDEDLSVMFREDENDFFEDNSPTINLNINSMLSTLDNEKVEDIEDILKENSLSKNDEIGDDDLLNALMSEPSPIKEQESILLNDLLSQDSPLKSNLELAKEIEDNIKIVKPTGNSLSPDNKKSNINVNELFNALNNEKQI